jgi:chromosome segregation ATPase
MEPTLDLEEKRRRLLSIRDEAREAHHMLVNERAAYEQRVAAVVRELAQARREIADGQRQLQTERRRVHDFRRRLKRRWHRHWVGERAILQRREATINDQRRALEKERARLQQEQAALAEARLRLNGERELVRRELVADRESLHKERQQVQEKAQTIARREAALAEAEQKLDDDKRHWDDLRGRLQAEVEGLENRLANQRRNLAEIEREMKRLRPPPEIPASPPAPREENLHQTAPIGRLRPAAPAQQEDDGPELQTRLLALEKLAAELADQRLVFVEQCEGLAQAQERWKQERRAALAELEMAGRRLEERAQALWLREQTVEAEEGRSQRRVEETARTQQQLEAGRAQLSAWASSWEAERNRLLAGIRAREDLVQQRLGILKELRERWDQRRRRHVLALRARRLACEQLRQECAVLRAEWLNRRNALEKEARSLAEQRLALEQYRQECLTKGSNPKIVEKRLERFRRRWCAQHAAAERSLAGEKESLDTQAAHLEERLRHLHQAEQDLTAQEADLSDRQSAWEKTKLLAEMEQGKLTREVQMLHRQREHYEEQVGDLRDEIERLAHLLLDQGEAPPLAVVKAA